MYVAKQDRYEKMTYRRTGKSGLKLPLLSLAYGKILGTMIQSVINVRF